MGIFGLNFAFRKKNKEVDVKDLPVGQSSLPEGEESISDIIDSAIRGARYAKNFFPLEILEYLETLSLITPDLSNAIDNIVRLGNTGHTIEIYGDEASAESLRDLLEAAAANIYPLSPGIDGLVNDMLSQIARFGALSAEWVISEDMTAVERIVLVPVKTIRFIKKDGGYSPVQKASWLASNKEFIELNPNTYLYYALERTDSSPYAVPPFLSAIENVTIQKDVIKQLRFIAKKYGFLGFLRVLVTAPQQRANETADQYKARCKTYLADIRQNLKGAYNDGLAIGFKDVQTFEHSPIAASAAGVSDLFKLNEEQIASGIRQDPAMLGRSYSTTETYAGVVFQKMLSQITNYQRLIKRALEHGYKIIALLNSVGGVEKISVKFNESNLVNRAEKAQSLAQEILNANALYDAGIIDQNQRAQILGYDVPALDGNRSEQTPIDIEKSLKQQQSASKKNTHPALILSSNSQGSYEVLERRIKVF